MDSNSEVVTEYHRTWDTQCECEKAPAPVNKGVRVTQLTGVTAKTTVAATGGNRLN